MHERGLVKVFVMRHDMSKVIVERPRLRCPFATGSMYPRARQKNKWFPDLENAPRIESMGGEYAWKMLNENLQPLVRFLRSSVGRLWNDVHSEISERISCKSAVQKHVLDHLRGFVDENVILVDGVVFYKTYKGYEPLLTWGMRFRFYVDPISRILSLAPSAKRKGRNKEKPDPNRCIISHELEMRRINGIWYEIMIAPIPTDEIVRARCYDVLERSLVDNKAANDLWQSNRYAAKKRQLSTDEIRRLSLRSRR